MNYSGNIQQFARGENFEKIPFEAQYSMDTITKLSGDIETIVEDATRGKIHPEITCLLITDYYGEWYQVV